MTKVSSYFNGSEASYHEPTQREEAQDMCDYWHEPTNTRLLASALMVVAIYSVNKFTEGKPERLWEIRPGVSAWTFSYHDLHKEGETFYHWHSSLNYFESEGEAREAMGNFVRGLNLGWRAG